LVGHCIIFLILKIKNAAMLKAERAKKAEKFPETTQRQYGWKRPNPLYQKLSGHARPKQSIHVKLKWPVDGCN